MAQNSKIEWTHHTANLWHGCTKVHEGCDHCYAETLSKRWKRDIWGNDKPRMEIKSVWNDLRKFQQLAFDAGEVHRVFIGSMMDIFEKPMPLIDSTGQPCMLAGERKITGLLRDTLFENISDGKYPNLMLLFLTKRPSNINKYIPESWKTNPPANVMFGTSPVNQETANKLIPQLLQVKGKKFISCEPLLGPINLQNIRDDNGHLNVLQGVGFDEQLGWLPLFSKIDWVIVGGESGHGARPMHPDWARSIRDQCQVAGVPFFFKQWGEYIPHCQIYNSEKQIPTAAQRFFPSPHNPNKTNTYYKIGKKEAGRVLDGQEYNEFPKQPSNQNQIMQCKS